MVDILVSYKVVARNDNEVKEHFGTFRKFYNEILDLTNALKPQIDEQFNDYILDVSFNDDLRTIDFEECGETDDGTLIYEIFDYIWASLINPVAIEDEREINEYTIWKQQGCKTFKEYYEPLYNIDWSTFKQIKTYHQVNLGGYISVRFDSINATNHYNGRDYYFYNHVTTLD